MLWLEVNARNYKKKLLDHKAYNCMRNITHVRSGDNKLGRLLMGMKRETRNVIKLKWSGQRSDHGISCACTHITMQEVDTHITMQEWTRLKRIMKSDINR